MWTDGNIVKAIQFHMNSGFVSELYGAPLHTSNSATPTSFEGKHPGSRLVGVHGIYDTAIIKLGFTFATFEPVGVKFPLALVEAHSVGIESNAVVTAKEEEGVY